MDAEFDSASNEYPHCILLTNPATLKIRNTWKMWWWHHRHVFSGISCFWGSRVHQKYVVWVLVQCGIKLCIQRALPLKIWVKTQGDMSKIWTKKSSFLLWQICQFNHYGWLILLKFYCFLNSNSQKLILARFLIRPILDAKFPLMYGFHENIEDWTYTTSRLKRYGQWEMSKSTRESMFTTININ